MRELFKVIGKFILFVFIILFGINVLFCTAEEITTGNLLPNGTNNASNYQSVDSTIPNITTNGFNTSGGIRDWGQEIETTGTGSINYTGSLIDITTGDDTTTQEKLDNGVTLNSTTVVQNCEFVGSNWQCGQARQGQDTYTTTVKILDEDGNVLATVNQTRNNDAGYNANAFKYEDSVTYSGTGSNQFYWEWEGVDEGYDSYGTSLGGPNLLGAKLSMTYDNYVQPPIEDEVIDEIEEVIDEFEEWEENYNEPIFDQVEFQEIPLEEFETIVIEEELELEAIETAQELEEEFEEMEILQVLGPAPKLETLEEPKEEVNSTPVVTELEEEFEEFLAPEPQKTETTAMEEEEPTAMEEEPTEETMTMKEEEEPTPIASSNNTTTMEEEPQGESTTVAKEEEPEPEETPTETEETMETSEVSEEESSTVVAKEESSEKESTSEETEEETVEEEGTEETTAKTEDSDTTVEDEDSGTKTIKVDASKIEEKIKEVTKDVGKQLQATNVILSQIMVNSQVDISKQYGSVNKQMFDTREIYKNKQEFYKEDNEMLNQYAFSIYENQQERMIQINGDDPVLKFQTDLNNAINTRKKLEQELWILRNSQSRR